MSYKLVDDLIQKMLAKFHDKERERSDHSAQIASRAYGTKRVCPLEHNKMSWSNAGGVLAYICVYCGATACEDEIKDRGFEFDTILYDEILIIFELDLERQSGGNAKQFAVGGL